MGIVSAIDSELTEYHQGIAGRKRKTGGGFEQAMMALLTFLGFSCIHTGDGSENPDILAWGPDPSIVYVFECTVAEPDLRGKSTKFATRIRHIKYQNPQSTVIGILATILHREMINHS